MITDYSEVMATKQNDLSKMNNFLANREWVEACILADRLESEFKQLYEYCAEKGIQDELTNNL